MGRYYFNIKEGATLIPDPEGEDLPDESAAYSEIRATVRRRTQASARLWRLAVMGAARVRGHGRERAYGTGSSSSRPDPAQLTRIHFQVRFSEGANQSFVLSLGNAVAVFGSLFELRSIKAAYGFVSPAPFTVIL